MFNIVSIVMVCLTGKMGPEPIVSIEGTVNGETFERQCEVTCKQAFNDSNVLTLRWKQRYGNFLRVDLSIFYVNPRELIDCV